MLGQETLRGSPQSGAEQKTLDEDALAILLQSIPGGAILFMAEAKRLPAINANQAILDALTYTPKDFAKLFGAESRKLFAPEAFAFIANQTENLLLGKKAAAHRVQLLKSDGIACWFECRLSLLRTTLCAEPVALALFEDVNQLVALQSHLDEQSALISMSKVRLIEELEYERSIKQINAEFYEHILEVDLTHDMLFGTGTDAIMRGLGIGGGNSYGQYLERSAQKNIHPDYRQKYLELFSRQNLLQAFKEGRNLASMECLATEDDGKSFYWLEISSRTFHHPSTGSVRAITYRRNIDKLKKQEIRLLEKAQQDSLTRLYNKRTAQTLVDEYLRSGEGKKGRHALFMIDLDNFKKVNDSLGHGFGDKVLTAFADEMKKAFKRGDILGRIGGDEFVVLAKGCGDAQKLRELAESVCARLAKTYDGRLEKYVVSASVGIALFPEHGKCYKDLQERADNALYYSKGHGKNTFTVFSESLDTENVGFFRERDLSELINSSTDGIGKFALDGGVSLLFYNRKLLELFGISAEDSAAASVMDFVVDSDKKKLLAGLKKAHKIRRVFSATFCARRAGGRLLHLRVKGMFTGELHLEKFPVFYLLFTDVSDLVELNEKLAYQQRKITTVNELTNDLIFEYFPESGRFKILGDEYAPSGGSGLDSSNTASEFLQPEDVFARNIKGINAAMLGAEDTFSAELSLQSNMKGAVPFALFGRKLRGGGGKVISVIGKLSNREVEFRQKAELERNKRMLEGLSRISMLLISTRLGSFEERMHKSLAIMGEILQLDSVSIWRVDRNDAGEPYALMLYEWTQQLESRKNMCISENSVSPELYKKWSGCQKRNVPFLLSKKLFSAAKDMEYMNRRGLFSIFSLPIHIDGKFWGFIDLGSCVSSLAYTEQQKEILKMNSQLIISSIEERLATSF